MVEALNETWHEFYVDGRHNGTDIHMYMNNENTETIKRVQTGIRIEKRTLKVLKAIAELKDLTVGDLLEGILLHVYEGELPFGGDTLVQIENLKKVYGLTLTAKNSHRLKEASK